VTIEEMKHKNDFILIVLFIVVFTILSVLSPDRFLSFDNLQTMAFQMPEFGILTLGMMIVILTGGINLSITAVSALSGIMTALFLVNCNAAANTNVFFIVAGALGIALICAIITGFINGFIIAFIGVTPILATLGAKIFFEGICLKITSLVIQNSFIFWGAEQFSTSLFQLLFLFQLLYLLIFY
jgi:simple sugar transport system permease protein